MNNYSLIELGKLHVTHGLKNLVGKEISVYSTRYKKEDLKIAINYLVDYLKFENKTINHLETFGCGSWMIQFVENETYVELHELKKVENGINIYEFTIDTTIYYLKSQLELCSSLKVTPSIPRLGNMIAISKEIYEGSEINAVRYDSPDHMSGWYLTSNDFNGDIKTLSVDHLYHLLKARPEIAKFLALPSGYRFFKDELGEDIWYDKDIV